MLKKREIAEGTVESMAYPDRGYVRGPEGEKVMVKNALPGQKIRYAVTKKREERYQGRLMEVLSFSPSETEEAGCGAFPDCGGCLFRRLPYEEELALKEQMVKGLIASGNYPAPPEDAYEGILANPHPSGYRNKMEFSFGNERKDGPLMLGLHRRGAAYDILSAEECALVTADVRAIVKTVLAYCREQGFPYYRKTSHEGYLRHLLVRRSESEEKVLVCLVTTSQEDHDFAPLAQRILALQEVNCAGIVHGINDLPADTVQYQSARILYGEDYLTEHLLGLSFHISMFSFFQTNTSGAGKLYGKVREYLREFTERSGRAPVIYDLYSGTGTIAQILAPEASRVYGIEIVEEAVEAARKNAAVNGLDNCTFYCGDVGAVLTEGLPEPPDFVILDPPREGLTPKALQQILRFDVPQMIYVSCKATSFVRDMEEFAKAGWRIEKWCLCDLFSRAAHVETVCCLYRQKKDFISVPYKPKNADYLKNR
ncbi:MAG: 23S rRNA (uracil(1939)-C(5))-methyltransferase RlmD [Lachnospiraceae bacterium]|nr:23S rRNA (uracil(1939)-C(5))-methyltransferase RlmD [Lachnospiraceae bacterium]